MPITDKNRKLVAGIGSALVDILITADDVLLQTSGVSKGGMTLVDSAFIEKTLAKVTVKPQIVPGGSACNTIIGIGNLGGKARFVGKLGSDEFARLFEADLKKNGVESILFKSSLPTGRVLTVITPDAQRTMFTFLGASAETQPEEITTKCFDRAAVVHIEGYLVFNRQLILAALESAKKAGARVSFDLASFTIVESEKDFIESIVREYVDILIANEDEAVAFTGHTDEKNAFEALSKKAEIVIVKLGKRGSYISHANKIIRVAPEGSKNVIDTTGAGDLWAAGFLYGLVNGFPLAVCGKLASQCGYEVCRVVGANISPEGWVRIKKSIK